MFFFEWKEIWEIFFKQYDESGGRGPPAASAPPTNRGAAPTPGGQPPKKWLMPPPRFTFETERFFAGVGRRRGRAGGRIRFVI